MIGGMRSDVPVNLGVAVIGFTVSICWYFSAKQNIFSIKPQLQLVQSSKSIEQPAQLANNNNIDISQQFSQKNQAFDINPQTKENINIQPEETVVTKTVVDINENETGNEDQAKQLSLIENSKISVEQKYLSESAIVFLLSSIDLLVSELFLLSLVAL